MYQLRRFFFGLLLMSAACCQAQIVAVKTNLITPPSLAMEVSLKQRNSIQLSYEIRPYGFGQRGGVDSKAQYWLVVPEYRRWMCSAMNGWFVGVHAMAGQFNIGNVNMPVPGVFFSGLDIGKAVKETSRVEGTLAGAGINAGYQWILGRHWNLEVEAGVGYFHAWHKEYEYHCTECGSLIDKGETNYVGLTKLGISFMYVF